MADVNYHFLQKSYDKIYSYFKTTTEQFDYLEWDGKILKVWNKNKVVETYEYKDLEKLIEK